MKYKKQNIKKHIINISIQNIYIVVQLQATSYKKQEWLKIIVNENN